MTEIGDVFAKVMEHTCFLDGDSNETELVTANQRDWTGDTPLHVATRQGWTWAIPILINSGAQVNLTGERGLTALHYAAFKNDLSSATTLLVNGADPNIRDDDGRTPVDWALAAGNETMVSLLKSKKSWRSS